MPQCSRIVLAPRFFAFSAWLPCRPGQNKCASRGTARLHRFSVPRCSCKAGCHCFQCAGKHHEETQPQDLGWIRVIIISDQSGVPDPWWRCLWITKSWFSYRSWTITKRTRRIKKSNPYLKVRRCWSRRQQDCRWNLAVVLPTILLNQQSTNFFSYISIAWWF